MELMYQVFYKIYHNLKSKPSNIPNLFYVDMENNIVSTIKSDYYEQDSFRHTTQNFKEFFSLFHLNIRSLNLHFEELHAALNLLEHSFDVIGITEIKLSDSSKNHYLYQYQVMCFTNNFAVVEPFM